MLEKSCGWWLIWYFLFFCHGGAEGQLQWVVKEKITDYGQDLTLFCPAENCCSSEPQAGWSVGKESKILDVTTFSNDPNSKYHATYNTDGFGIVIRNLSEADFNVTYHCNYGFNESTPTSLRHGDVFKENVPDKDKDKENDTVAENNTVTIVLSIVVPIVVIMVGFIIAWHVYRSRRKEKKEKPRAPDTEVEKRHSTPSDDQIKNEQDTEVEKRHSTPSDDQIKNEQGTKDDRKVLKDSDNKAKDQPGTEEEKRTLITSDDLIKNEQGTKDDMKVLKDSDNKAKDQPDSPPKPEEVPLMEVVAPGQPRNIKGNVLSPNRIEVSWLPPTDSASKRSYNIYFNDSSVMGHRHNNYVLEDLIPDTVYQIQVSAITNGREEEKSPMIEVKTSPLVEYRVIVTFTKILYSEQLNDWNSNEFKSLAENIQKVLTGLYDSVPGKQEVVVIQFKPGSLLTIFDLTSRGYDKESVLRETIEKPLKDGIIGSYEASLVGFDFRTFSVVYRVDVTFTDNLYTIQLDDRNSNEFKSLAGKIQTDLTKLFVKVPGKQVVVIVQFQHISGSLLTTFDLTCWRYYGESVLRETIEKPLKDGIIGRYKASLEGFNFKPFSGDFHGAIVKQYRSEPKIPKDLLDDQEFLSKLLEECGKNTEGLLPYSSGIIDVVYFPATLLVVVMKCGPKTKIKIVEEVVKDMFTTLTSQPPSTVVIVYHRSVKTAMEKVPEKERKKHILEKFIKYHKFDYSASPWLQQFMDCLKKK